MGESEANRQLAEAAMAIARALEEGNRLRAETDLAYVRWVDIQERQFALSEQSQKSYKRQVEQEEESGRLYRERLQAQRRSEKRGLIALGFLLVVLPLALIPAYFLDRQRNHDASKADGKSPTQSVTTP